MWLNRIVPALKRTLIDFLTSLVSRETVAIRDGVLTGRGFQQPSYAELVRLNANLQGEVSELKRQIAWFQK
jgi:hypothetical protein